MGYYVMGILNNNKEGLIFSCDSRGCSCLFVRPFRPVSYFTIKYMFSHILQMFTHMFTLMFAHSQIYLSVNALKYNILGLKHIGLITSWPRWELKVFHEQKCETITNFIIQYKCLKIYLNVII